MVNGIEISDDSGVSESETLSIKEIILRQLRKIGDLSCREFTGGYWEKKPVKTGSGIFFSEVYHDDVREAYCNAVDFLIDIVYPIGDDDLKKYLVKYEKFKVPNLKYRTGGEEKETEEDYTKELSILEKNAKLKKKLALKRQTFRQINIMFETNNFFKGSLGYSE